MNKKVISSVLAGTMAISTMGIVASADPAGNQQEGNIAYSAKASLMEATIDANIPQDIETFINPYGAKVTSNETYTGTVMYSDGLISPTYKIENLSEDALKVSATAKITPSSTVAVNTKVLDEVKLQKATEKQVFAFLNTTTASIDTDTPIFASTSYINNAQQLAFTEDGAKAADIMTIPAVASAGTAEDAAKGFFYVGGQCTPNPEEAWTSKDTVTVDLILDLSPSAGKPADLSVSSVKIANKTYTDFLPGTYSYNLVAAGSATKAVPIEVTAKDADAVVYVMFNDKVYTADNTPVLNAATGAAEVGDLECEVGKTAKVSAVVVTAFDDGADPGSTSDDTPGTTGDFKAGEKLSFIVYNSKTGESITYTFNFTE